MSKRTSNKIMRIITPTYEIWNQEEGLEGIFKQIEFST